MSFTKNFFTGNRQNLAKLLPKHVLFIAANAVMQESADVGFPFRQDSNFWYLTGVEEPDAVLVLDCDTGVSTLLLPEQNEYQTEWDGSFNKKLLKQKSGIDDIDSIVNLEKYVRKGQEKRQTFGYCPPLHERIEPYGMYANPARRLLEKKIKNIAPSKKLIDIRLQLARLRQVKQPVEITAIQKAVDITAESLDFVKARLGEYQNEKDIERALISQFYIRGADGHAYFPIIASGKNASIIHYEKNNQPLKKNELLLLDIGAKVDGYAADISRTWILGAPSKRQKELYSMVFEVQQMALDMLKPGVIIREYQKEMERKAKELYSANGVDFERYPHLFSHFLGLDVHDAGLYDEPLQEGTVLTVEPGVYSPKEGIGIRIEDDIVITKNGIKNLSISIPKVL